MTMYPNLTILLQLGLAIYHSQILVYDLVAKTSIFLETALPFVVFYDWLGRLKQVTLAEIFGGSWQSITKLEDAIKVETKIETIV
jgi:hypothetical protein